MQATEILPLQFSQKHIKWGEVLPDPSAHFCPIPYMAHNLCADSQVLHELKQNSKILAEHKKICGKLTKYGLEARKNTWLHEFKIREFMYRTNEIVFRVYLLV